MDSIFVVVKNPVTVNPFVKEKIWNYIVLNMVLANGKDVLAVL